MSASERTSIMSTFLPSIRRYCIRSTTKTDTFTLLLACEISHLPASRPHTPRGPATVLGPSRVSIQRAGSLRFSFPRSSHAVTRQDFQLETIFDLQASEDLALRVFGGTCVPTLQPMQEANFIDRSVTALGRGTALCTLLYFLCDQI